MQPPRSQKDNDQRKLSLPEATVNANQQFPSGMPGCIRRTRDSLVTFRALGDTSDDDSDVLVDSEIVEGTAACAIDPIESTDANTRADTPVRRRGFV